MVSWRDFWGCSLDENMKDIEINGKNVTTYQNMPPTLYHGLCASAQHYGERTALVDPMGTAYTYQTFLKMVDDLADCLHQYYHITKGTHVGLMLYNGIEFCTSFLALCKLGAVAVSLPSKYTKQEILSLLKKADTQFVLCETTFLGWFFERQGTVCITSQKEGYGFAWLVERQRKSGTLEPQGALGDPFVFMFTSGTTSKSKGVLLSNYHVMHGVQAYQLALNLTFEDITLLATPMYHITGMVCILAVFITIGGTVYIQKKVEPSEMLDCISRANITFLHASPTVFTLLLGNKQDFQALPRLKCFACGSSNIPPENIRRLQEWLPNVAFHTIYGMTETTGAGTFFPTGAAESPYIGASGVPMPNLELKILDAFDEEVVNNHIGEVCLRGNFLLEGYYNQSSADIMADGWFKTGDLGCVNDAGYLYILDRKKDMINRGGEKICSFDIENELHLLCGIVEAAVVGIPDDKYIEVPVAMVKVDENFHWDAKTITEVLLQRVARFKVPIRYIFTSEIPKTANGKVDKRKIKEIFMEEVVHAATK